MTKKIERVFRDRQLTAEEAAHDNEVRRKVMAEFPPASRRSNAPGRLTAALKEALQTCEKSMYQVAQDAGVSQIVLTRFLSGERDIRMATADKLAETLGLKLAVGRCD